MARTFPNALLAGTEYVWIPLREDGVRGQVAVYADRRNAVGSATIRVYGSFKSSGDATDRISMGSQVDLVPIDTSGPDLKDIQTPPEFQSQDLSITFGAPTTANNTLVLTATDCPFPYLVIEYTPTGGAQTNLYVSQL